MRGPTWTAEQVTLAEQLVARDASNEDCMAALGRSRHACNIKVKRWPDQRGRSFRMPRADFQPQAPDHLWQEATLRLTAPRSLTAIICGDPAPGYSALERRA